MHTMTERKHKAGRIDLKGLVGTDREFLRELIRTTVQEVLEAEMTDALGAAKSERTAGRNGYRSGYYGRSLITRVGKAGVARATGSRWAVFDRAVRALSAFGARLGGGAGRDVRPRRPDPQGQGDYRRVMRA